VSLSALFNEAVATALRLAIKEAFDDCAAATPRKALVPEMPGRVNRGAVR
jgi:hypothetical protein